MKLYYVVGSPNCRKVHATANHLGSALDLEFLDFFEGDLKRPDYLSINPNGMVPSLQDGDLNLWESNAIMQYLADKVPGNSLFPADGRTRIEIVRWQCWELAHYNRAFALLAWEAVSKPGMMDMEPNRAIVQWAKDELETFAQVLESHLQGRSYLVGDDITLADYSMIHVEMFKEAIPFDWSPYPRVNAYYERMRAVSHWARTAPSKPEAMGRRPA